MHQYKYGLVFDTNVFVDLTKENCFPEHFFTTFEWDLLLSKEVLFIIPEQVQIEWHRTLEEKTEGFINKEKKPILEALDLAKYFDSDDQKTLYTHTLNQALRLKERIYKYVSKKRMQLISRALFSESTVYDVRKTIVKRTAEMDKMLVDLSLNHTAPFFGNDQGKGKINEMADALIFFSACDFAKNNPDLCESYYFVSGDGGFSKGPELHKNIKNHAEEANLKFYCSFKTFLDNEFKKQTEKNIDRSGLFNDKPLILSDRYFKKCEKCNGEIHINIDGYFKSLPVGRGEYWYYLCECGHEWTEGEDMYS
ncbi:hypothetical protein CN918_29655 [Priestia megaterium]|nr:hypothetical protein CN918_29655 [Priestia megaterium]